MNRTCDNCGKTVGAKKQMYSIKIEMFARAEPLIFSTEDLADDHSKALTELLKKMENIDSNEATDQVHESYLFDLCSQCRSKFHKQLKRKSQAKS